MVLTLLFGAVLHLSGAIEIELPKWLLAGTYALLGWSVGLRLTPAVLVHAAPRRRDGGVECLYPLPVRVE